MKRSLVVALCAALLATLATPALASHFRGANYTWVSAGGNATDFQLSASFRRTANPCVNPTAPPPATPATVACSAGDGFPQVGDVIAENTGDTNFDFGDGVLAATGRLHYLVTAIDLDNNFLTGLALDETSFPMRDTSIRHTYASPGNYTAFTASSARVDGSVNASGAYRVETTVNVGSGNSNRPPVSALPPIVFCPAATTCSVSLPAADPDNDTLRWRFSTPGESGIANQPGPPFTTNAAVIAATTGIFTWDTTGAMPAVNGQLYSAQVTIEDLDGSGNPKSKIAVDFIVAVATPFGVAPVFESPTPPCGSTIDVAVGTEVTFDVKARDADSGDTVTLNVAGLPPGSSMTPSLPTVGNPVVSSFDGMPTTPGVTVLNFYATDSHSRQASCAITINATPPKPTLEVVVVGRGKVHRSDGPPCATRCTATLSAEPDAGWTFAGWAGACIADPCKPTADGSVTATFTPEP